LQNILKDSDTSQFPWYPFFKLTHITLCHLYASDEEISEISSCIEEMVTKMWSIHLVNVWIEQWNLNHISNEKNVQLMMFHRSINNVVRPYLWRKWKPEYFLGSDICDITIERVNGYSHKKHSPHITLWPWAIDSSYNERRYTASWIALCHLWKYCTIGEVLKTFDLS
jgi:hypothetical protein